MCPADVAQETAQKIYSRAEKLTDAVVHVSGLMAAIVAVPVLITVAVVWRGDVSAIVGTSIYGATLIAMILCSALYHMVPLPSWKGFLRRLDHSAIFCKIAGTYTPFTLLSGGQGAYLLTGLWGAAIAGTGIRLLAPPDRYRWFCFGLYLGMGWAGVAAGWALFAVLPSAAMALIVAGGLIYTIGTIFYLWDTLPFHTAIWHGFVLVATIIFYAAVTIVVLDITPSS